MSFALKRSLYEALPRPLKIPFGWIPFGLTAGAAYRRALRKGNRFDRASDEEIRAYQQERLGRMLRFAVDQVPAYHGLRSTVERLKPFEALQAFPPIDKATLQRDFARYIPRDLANIPHYEDTTGGTSGNQLRFFLDSEAHAAELGFIHRMWARVDYTPRCRKATFRGMAFPSLPQNVYWQHNPVYRELQFSPFHMAEQTLGRYVEQLCEFRPQYLHGYPSAITLLGDYVLRHGISLGRLRLRAILLGSEALYPGQRETLERAFSCRAFSWYGHSEKLLLAGECEHSSVYHQFPDYGILEILDEDGAAVVEDGARGELVGTGIRNRSLPLIRYRTEDFARLRRGDCECGRRFERFDEVQGRWRQEYVIGRTGAKISPAALNMHGPMFAEVLRYQYYQSEPGVMQLRLMVTERFDETDARALREAFASKVGSELEIELRTVADIPLTARGKLRRLIQEIPPERMP